MDNAELETLALVIQLQQQEIKGLSKGKGRAGDDPSDAEYAADLYRTELEQLRDVLADRTMCLSIDQAVRTDGFIIQIHSLIEEQAVRDRQQALTGRRPASPRAKVTKPPTSVTKALSLGPPNTSYKIGDDDEVIAGPSSRGGDGRLPRCAPSGTQDAQDGESCQEGNYFCIACSSQVSKDNSIQCPCSHCYCKECINELHTLASSDESLFPPRCCKQEMPVSLVKSQLFEDVRTKFEERSLEFRTKDKTYCHIPTCSTFIPPAGISADIATCPQCKTSTCSICKGATHKGDCPNDDALKALLALAEENGWKRCTSCHVMVELNHGCNHITCRCKHQFCYVCSVPWKKCKYAQWNEENLYARGEAVVRRQAGAQHLAGAQYRQAVALEVQNQRANHNCEHRGWSKRYGSHECDECNDELPDFIFECNRCHLMACWRCRNNRL